MQMYGNEVKDFQQNYQENLRNHRQTIQSEFAYHFLKKLNILKTTCKLIPSSETINWSSIEAFSKFSLFWYYYVPGVKKIFRIWAAISDKRNLFYNAQLRSGYFFISEIAHALICYDYFPEKQNTWNVQERITKRFINKIVKSAPQNLQKLCFLISSNHTEVELHQKPKKNHICLFVRKTQDFLDCWKKTMLHKTRSRGPQSRASPSPNTNPWIHILEVLWWGKHQQKLCGSKLDFKHHKVSPFAV